MRSGGSTVSASLIPLARTVMVQVVAPGRLAVGSRVIVEVPEPLTLKSWRFPDVGHSIVNEPVVAFTGSLNVTVMLSLGFTSVASLAGLVLETVGAASSVVNEKAELAAGWSGGSRVSVSLMEFATAVTVQLVPCGRSAAGSSVIAWPGEPETVNVFALPPQVSVKELVETVTDSLKLTTMFVFTATLVAPFAGTVVVTAGGASAGGASAGVTNTGVSFDLHWESAVT